MYERAVSAVKMTRWLKLWHDAETAMGEGHWWEAHVYLEEIWLEAEQERLRRELRAVIQLVAACHKPAQAQHPVAAARGLRLDQGMERLLSRVAPTWDSAPDSEQKHWVWLLYTNALEACASWARTGAPAHVQWALNRVPTAALVRWWDADRSNVQAPHSNAATPSVE